MSINLSLPYFKMNSSGSKSSGKRTTLGVILYSNNKLMQDSVALAPALSPSKHKITSRASFLISITCSLVKAVPIAATTFVTPTE